MKNLLFVVFMILMVPFMVVGFVWHVVRWGFMLGAHFGNVIGQWCTE